MLSAFDTGRASAPFFVATSWSAANPRPADETSQCDYSTVTGSVKEGGSSDGGEPATRGQPGCLPERGAARAVEGCGKPTTFSADRSREPTRVWALDLRLLEQKPVVSLWPLWDNRGVRYRLRVWRRRAEMTPIGAEELVQLKSSKAQLEVGLIYLKRRRAELDKQRAVLERDPRSDASKLSTLAQTIAGVTSEVTTREESARKLAEEIARAERKTQDETIEQTMLLNQQMAGELSAIRSEVLTALRDLADPLHRYQEIADRKTQLVRKLAASSERDLSYPNYLDCALFRQSEQDESLRYVLDVLKRLRVVA
jgi:uncharacterized protein YoxC